MISLKFNQKLPAGIAHLCRINHRRCYQHVQQTKPQLHRTSKEIRKVFIDYFVKEKAHTYVQSSPVFLNNDPSLLLVNAGMNQFKSKLLNTTSPNHSFYHLKTAANSQKCIRISGKHNDFDDVGHDFHHHTFFEMMGNWSFGDYFKREACTMAWELLTKVYGLPKERLYVTYFGGDEILCLPADKECKQIWQDIGVPESHILPFGAKENFWDMGETGPCGPCTEIHYDYIGMDPNASNYVNAGRSNVIEIWNLVFIQYKRDGDGKLEVLPVHNVDTGMGLERLTAVMQGTMSNYDTDIFKPIFHTIKKNFKVRPYGGNIGCNDDNGIDTAYRIIADHARMFSIAIADGIFPDSSDAGYVLRKVIRRAAYMANRVMKTKPGVLSSIVPQVAETLDFFPELLQNYKEVMAVVDDEEKMFHHIINRGRKARNRMMANATDNILGGKSVWELHFIHGLDENIIQDLASEVNFNVDWNGYKICNEQEKEKSEALKKSDDSLLNAINLFKTMNLPSTDDSYKYSYDSSQIQGIEDINAKVLAIVEDGKCVNSTNAKENCFIVTDKTNFYSNSGGQVSDTGIIYVGDSKFHLKNIHALSGYVLHEGTMSHGEIQLGSDVTLSVDQEHRHQCARNHSATHLLNSALRKIYPYSSQQSSYVGPDYLRLGFNSRSSLSTNEISRLEKFVNTSISEKLPVLRHEMSFDVAQGLPNIVLLHGEEYPQKVYVISIVDQDGNDISVEPCCGTHITNTEDLYHFVISASKSNGTMRTLFAVTGKKAKNMLQNAKTFEDKLSHLKNTICDLEAINADTSEYLPILKNVKKLLHECNVSTDLPCTTVRLCESELKDLKFKLMDITSEPAEQNSVPVKKQTALDTIRNFVQNIPPTNDTFKYSYFSQDGKQFVAPIESRIIAMFTENEPVKQVVKGQHCFVVTDKTNFYSENEEQACDVGVISCDAFLMDVTDVHSVDGLVFHEGWVKEGSMSLNSSATLKIDQQHRENCSFHHTASHLLHSVLKKSLPYMFLTSSFASDTCLRLQFKSKVPLSMDILQNIEDVMKASIKENLMVSRTMLPLSDIKKIPDIFIPTGEVFPDPVTIISIGNEKSLEGPTSIQPCTGTHAQNTLELGNFVLLTGKSSKNAEKVIRAVVFKPADEVLENGYIYDGVMSELEYIVHSALKSNKKDYLHLWDLLRDVKDAKTHHEKELPVLMFRRHQDKLTELLIRLTAETDDFVQNGFAEVKLEMEELKKHQLNTKHIVHRIRTFGDGKKVVNYALSVFPERPAMFFAADGHKSLICSCSVPKECVSPSLSAVFWIEPVAAFLQGRTRTQYKDQELLFSIESNHTDKVDRAIEIANDFIKSC